MSKLIKAEYKNASPEEIAEMEAKQAESERNYWASISYDDAVNAEIRKQYTASQEFAILRQKDEKPEEYEAYYAYCENCKTFVKQKMQYAETDGAMDMS